mgnify:CR=1 FL=1
MTLKEVKRCDKMLLHCLIERETKMTFKKIISKTVRENKFSFFLAVIMITIASFLQASSIIGIAPIIDMLIYPDLSRASNATIKILNYFKQIGIPSTFMSVAVFFIGLVFIRNTIAALAKFIVTKIHFRLIKNIIFDEYKSFLMSSWQFFVSKKYGVLGNTIVRETEKVGLSFEAFVEMFSLLLNIFFYLTVGFFLSWKLTLIVLGLIGVGLLPFYLLGRTTYKIGKVHTAASNDFQGAILETFNAAKLVLGFGNQHISIRKFSQVIPAYVKTAIQFIMIRTALPLAFEPVGMVIILFVVYLGLYVYKMDVSELLIMLYAFRTSIQYAMSVIQQRHAILNMAPALEQIYQLKEEAGQMKQPSGEREFEKLKTAISLENVSFSYPTQKDVLKNIQVMIPKGKMVAIVGRSGAGKTTLIDILMGFYQVKEGEHRIDGIPFSQLDINSWRRKIGYVPQDAFLFNMSIKENLLWSNEAATDEEIAKVCAMANAAEFIQRFPEKFNTIVGEHGVRLSGGQRQRIALARAMLRKPELLILDEATSSLDSQSELLIQRSIEDVAKETTLVVIAHRLSTIRKADYIYVLDQGSVVEEGTFEHLVTIRDGKFLKAAELQGIGVVNELPNL